MTRWKSRCGSPSIRRAELDAEATDRRTAQRDTDNEREAQKRERLRDIRCAPDPGDVNGEPTALDREDSEVPDGPDAAKHGPDIDR